MINKKEPNEDTNQLEEVVKKTIEFQKQETLKIQREIGEVKNDIMNEVKKIDKKMDLIISGMN